MAGTEPEGWLHRVDDGLAGMPAWARPPFHGMLSDYAPVLARAGVRQPLSVIGAVIAGGFDAVMYLGWHALAGREGRGTRHARACRSSCRSRCPCSGCWKRSGARQHVAVVLGKYGGDTGIVTLDGVFQDLAGDVPGDDQGPGDVGRGDGCWLVDGQTSITDLAAPPDVALNEEARRGHETLDGFGMSRPGHLAGPAEHFTWSGHRFEVLDMDGRRDDRVLGVRERANGRHPDGAGAAGDIDGRRR